MKSLTTLLERVGLSDSIYEIFVDATEEVLNRTHAAIQNGAQDESFLVDAFNEGYCSDAIITHFRVSSFSLWALVFLVTGRKLMSRLADFD
jgi:ubiquitin thioesterase protein OTUB1